MKDLLRDIVGLFSKSAYERWLEEEDRRHLSQLAAIERRYARQREINSPAKAEILAAGWPEGDGRLLGLPGPENEPTGFLGPKVHNLEENKR